MLKAKKNVIDFGSGPWPKADANIRMDWNDFPGVTVKHSLLDTPYPFESNFADKCYLGDVIEHIPIFEIERVLKEILRIMKPDSDFFVTTPDVSWITERLHRGDWKIASGGVDWLNRYPTDFENAMSYLYGGWYKDSEYRMPGMGHVAGYNFETLFNLLKRCGFVAVRQDKDPRHPSILLVKCRK